MLPVLKVNADFVQSAEAYARVAFSLFDGFISCWDEKYRSKLIRPETYINQYIDENWVPFFKRLHFRNTPVDIVLFQAQQPYLDQAFW